MDKFCESVEKQQLLRSPAPNKYFITSVFPPLQESCATDNYIFRESVLCCWVGGLTKLNFNTVKFF